MEITFGPVPSRRLGRSLGINHIPPKICSYACVYCQLGRTLKMQIEREAFYKPRNILESVRERLEQAQLNKEQVDYLALVPDGEPALDLNLGKLIELLKPLGIPIAVISNGSLMADAQVRADLALADWVSLKVDAVTESVWRAVDRPHRKLILDKILVGMLRFRDAFSGQLVTETMLIKDFNDTRTENEKISKFVSRLKPDTAYLSIPTRPPAEPQILPATPESVNQAFQIFSESITRVELLTGYEGNAFSTTGDIQSDILSITSVHPMRREALDKMIEGEGPSDDVLDQLLKSGALIETEFSGHKYYLRNFAKY